MSAERAAAVLRSQPGPLAASRGFGRQIRVELLGGELLTGSVERFSTSGPDFFLRGGPEGVARLVTFESVKTVAFLRAPGPHNPVTFQGQARLVTLRLADGELVSGVTHSFGGPRLGLFLVPAGLPGVERIYVPITAVREVVAVERLDEVIPQAPTVTPEMLDLAAARRHLRLVERPAAGPAGQQAVHRRRVDPSPLGEILVAHGSISRAELEEALAAQRQQPGRRLGEVVVAMGYTSFKMVGVALALQYGVPFLSLSGRPLEPALRALVPAELARRLRVLPLAREGRLLRVAVEDPAAPDMRQELERHSGLDVEEVVVTPQEMERALVVFYDAPPDSGGDLLPTAPDRARPVH